MYSHTYDNFAVGGVLALDELISIVLIDYYTLCYRCFDRCEKAMISVTIGSFSSGVANTNPPSIKSRPCI
jgi:hypothetical protein